MFFVFVLALCAVAQWIFMLVFLRNNKQEIDQKLAILEDKENGLKIIPYSNDNFFKVWNILPIAMNIVLFYIFYNYYFIWKLDIQENLIKASNIGTHIDNDYSIPFVIFFVVVSFLMACYSFRFQLKKQQNIIDGEFKEIYWWDDRVNKTVFKVRRWALPPNLFNILFCMLISTLILVEIINMIDTDSFRFILFHADQKGGFASLEKLILSATLIILMWISNGIFALTDHSKQGAEHMASNLLGIILGITLGISCLFYINQDLKNNLEDTHEQLICSMKNNRIFEKDECILKDSTRNQIIERKVYKSRDSIIVNLEMIKKNEEVIAEIKKIEQFNLFSYKTILLFLSAFWPLGITIYLKIKARKLSFEQD